MTENQIVEILIGSLSSVYCDTCSSSGQEENYCDECHRKYMNWGLSHNAARNIAKKILKGE